MHDNIDEIFKNKLENRTIKEVTKVWDKNASWDRMQRKRKKKMHSRFYYYAAAILIIGILITGITGNYIAKNETLYSESVFEEYQKRQRLKEIEAKMSGTYIHEEICLDCENIYNINFKKNRSVNPEYVDIFNQKLN